VVPGKGKWNMASDLSRHGDDDQAMKEKKEENRSPNWVGVSEFTVGKMTRGPGSGTGKPER